MLVLILNAYPHPPALLVGCIHIRTIVMNGAISWEVLMHTVQRSPSNGTLCDESSHAFLSWTQFVFFCPTVFLFLRYQGLTFSPEASFYTISTLNDGC